MSDGKKYVVPEGAAAYVAQAVFQWLTGCSRIHPEDTGNIGRIAAEAFVRWQAENPRRPTDDQVEELRSEHIGLNLKWMLVEWQRRMYLAPEPELEEIVSLRPGKYVVEVGGGLGPRVTPFLAPEPEVPYEVKDVLSWCDVYFVGHPQLPALKETMIVAYRRGQKSGSHGRI